MYKRACFLADEDLSLYIARSGCCILVQIALTRFILFIIWRVNFPPFFPGLHDMLMETYYKSKSFICACCLSSLWYLWVVKGFKKDMK